MLVTGGSGTLILDYNTPNVEYMKIPQFEVTGGNTIFRSRVPATIDLNLGYAGIALVIGGGTMSFQSTAATTYTTGSLNAGGLPWGTYASTGTINISNATTTVYSSGQVTIGQSDNNGGDGVGTLNVTDATLTTASDIMLGFVGGTGSMTVNGHTAKVNAVNIQAGFVWGGSPSTDQGVGHVTVNDGTVNVSGWVVLGAVGSIGDWTQNGGTTTCGTGMCVGQWDYYNGTTAGSGTLTLKGGVLVTPVIRPDSYLAAGVYPAGNGTVYFDGGTLTASADNLTGFMTTQGVGDTLNLYVSTGGANIDTGGHTVYQALWLQHDPALGPAGRRFDQTRRRHVGSVYEPVVYRANHCQRRHAGLGGRQCHPHYPRCR